MADLTPGQLLRGPRWPEPLEINLLEDWGEYVHLVGVLRPSGHHVDQVLPRSELAGLVAARVEVSFTAPARQVFLGLEARRYHYAALYDPLLAMNAAKVDPLPHQIEAVYGYVLRLPRIRFLIADDPGAGKTIMAGLIIKELQLRHLVRRILIVAPGHLKDQWRRELKERFAEPFVIVDRGLLDALYGENIWERESHIITSLDFAKRDEVLPALAAAHFDLVIVDEAHKMSAYQYGAKLDKTGRYRLGETLSRISTHLLFLTATPHRGDPENFRLFLDLLEPGFFATAEMVNESIRAQDNPLFIRRVKEDLRDFAGRPLFLPRHVETQAFDLGTESPAEKELYNALSKYVNEQYNRALTHDKRRNVAFALVILQRRLASSTYALYCSLKRRKKRLEELLQGAPESRRSENDLDLEAAEDLNEADRWQQEELWETLSVAENRQELEREIQTLGELIRQAEAIIKSGQEVKLRHLQTALAGLNARYPGAKVLIFTESRDTLDYLQRNLSQWGYTACTIHGGMRLEERIQAEGVFKQEAQVLIATEAAGEGINLQFCYLMLNYDLPWNPNRLEQRMGRIHRYGQTREVFIFNLVAGDTREGRVLKRLFDKLDEIRAALGSDKVFDVLGNVLYGKNLAQLLLEAAANARSLDEILQELEIRVDEAYLTRVRAALDESLATHFIDYTRMQQLADRAREYRLIPEYTEAFFKRAWEAAGGQVHTRKDGFLTVESVPYAVRQLAEEKPFQQRFGPLQRRYTQITFDKDLAFRHAEAEFVSFGHPLFEAVLAWVDRECAAAVQRGATFTDPDGQLDGLLLFYEGEIRDGLGQLAGCRLFTLYAERATGALRAVAPTLLWDLAESGDASGQPCDVEAARQQALRALLPALEQYRAELQAERDRQARIKQKYGAASLDHLILRLDGELINLYARRENGENVDLPIRNKEEQKRRYELALAELRQTVIQESSLTLGMPRFIGAVRVLPASPDLPTEDPQIEQIGMVMAMEYERAQGRYPEDVAAHNLGFDIRSTDPQTGQRRYIEVKARATRGPVELTQNEWFKAERFGAEYYLYVVLDAATQPRLHIIPHPAAVLQPEERVEVRYRVTVPAIVAHSVAAE